MTVVDLRTVCAYRPDYAAVARDRVKSARFALGLSHAEFADRLSTLVGWPVTPQAVQAWESDSVPPGDVAFALNIPVDEINITLEVTMTRAEVDTIKRMLAGLDTRLERLLGRLETLEADQDKVRDVTALTGEVAAVVARADHLAPDPFTGRGPAGRLISVNPQRNQ